MNGIEKLPELLKQKKELLLRFEAVTEQMYTLSPETLLDLVEERGRLLEKAGKLDEEIQEIGRYHPEVLPVLNNQRDLGGLEGLERQIYDASLAVKAVANRIRQNEDSLRQHIQLQKDAVLKRIENMNKSGYSVADKYYRSVQTGLNQPMSREREKKV